MYIYIYIYTYIYICTYVYIHLSLSLSLCICVCKYSHEKNRRPISQFWLDMLRPRNPPNQKTLMSQYLAVQIKRIWMGSFWERSNSGGRGESFSSLKPWIFPKKDAFRRGGENPPTPLLTLHFSENDPIWGLNFPLPLIHCIRGEGGVQPPNWIFTKGASKETTSKVHACVFAYAYNRKGSLSYRHTYAFSLAFSHFWSGFVCVLIRVCVCVVSVFLEYTNSQ